MQGKRKNWILRILLFLFCANILAWLTVFQLSQLQVLEVNFFDVGQGDAIFIETPQKHQILIDGGSTSLILEKLGKEMPFWDRTIDLVILTHPEYDHLGGLIEVLKNYKVENILWTGVLRDTSTFQEWQSLLSIEKAEGAQIKIAEAPSKINCSGADIKQCYFEILYPFQSLEGKIEKNTNNTSIILRLVFGENSLLFTGDAYQSIEKEILERGIDIDSDILKVGHHGSKTSSAEEFVEKVSPDIAVISAGKNNSYGHPHKETLDTLEKYGIKVLRTDINGDIKIFSDGENLKIKNQKPSFHEWKRR